jgi:hypothetical protein
LNLDPRGTSFTVKGEPDHKTSDKLGGKIGTNTGKIYIPLKTELYHGSSDTVRYPVKASGNLKNGNSFRRFPTYGFDKNGISFSRNKRLIVQKSSIG